ncbi:MAG: biotin--[acetyl-CoA-carboxylase] ligase, partial [Bradymonadaceae bacterium]
RSAGRTVRLDRGDRQRSGTARGIAEDGRLVVEIDGTEERVRAGSVEFVDL